MDAAADLQPGSGARTRFPGHFQHSLFWLNTNFRFALCRRTGFRRVEKDKQTNPSIPMLSLISRGFVSTRAPFNQ